MNPEQFQQALAERGINLSDAQMKQFAEYYDLLVATNEHVNLTRITEKKEVYLKHFFDSISGVFAEPKLMTDELTLCDIGAGAGFPSIPIKIAFPQLKVNSPFRKRLLKLFWIHFSFSFRETILFHVFYYCNLITGFFLWVELMGVVNEELLRLS